MLKTVLEISRLVYQGTLTILRIDVLPINVPVYKQSRMHVQQGIENMLPQCLDGLIMDIFSNCMETSQNTV